MWGDMRTVLALFFVAALMVTLSLVGQEKLLAQGAGRAQGPCSSLTADEQQFAFGLTPKNRQMFCGQFTPVQRAAAMQLTSQPDPTGALLSPDDAVSQVAESMNISPNSSGVGVCPAKK